MDRSRSPSISRPHPPPHGQGRSTSPLWDESPSPRITSPSRGRPRSYHARAPPSESRSRSRYSSRSSSVSSSKSQKKQQHHDHHKGLFKTSAGLLAGIGVATFLAHKVWPKGVIYGDPEDWASKKADKAEAKQQRRRPEPQRRTSEPHHGPPRRNHNHHEPPPRVIERVRERGKVTYREEIVPVRKGDGRRRDLEARGFERIGRNNERANQPLPYPDRAYPDERFYGPSNSRIRPGEPVYR